MNSADFLKRRPVTGWLMILGAFSFLINYFSFNFLWFDFLCFKSNTGLSKIWTIFTYPFAQNDIVTLVFCGLWTFTVCSILEETLSSLIFLIFLGISILIPPIFFYTVYLFHPMLIYLAGFWIPLSFLTIFWGSKYPTRVITFNFLFPLKAVWIAYITIAFVFFSFRDPLISCGMLIPCLAFFYAGRIYDPYRLTRKREDQKFKVYMSHINERKKKREEDEKLRRLFEESFKNKKD